VRFSYFHISLSNIVSSSDIDVAVSVPNLPEASTKSCLFQISSRLRNSNWVEESWVHHRAKAPIIAVKTTDDLGAFELDIGINNPAGVEAVAVIKNYVQEMPALRPLVLVMKGLFLQLGMNDPSKSGLGSYPLICMCIFFLKVSSHFGHNDSTLTHSLSLSLTQLIGLRISFRTQQIQSRSVTY
jgi:DNA polymerase sigma